LAGALAPSELAGVAETAYRGTAGRGDLIRPSKPFPLRPWSRPFPNLEPSSRYAWTIERSQGWRYLWCRFGETAVPQDPFIACIDDDKSVRDAIEGFLKALGFAVQAFSSAEDFLQSSRLNQTSCLIADVKLPGMSGLQLQQRLTASGQRVPTIFITAFSDPRRRAQALGAGAICFLEKPITKDDLLTCVQLALEQGRKGESS
jgi:CheY-like chemotaxis protein